MLNEFSNYYQLDKQDIFSIVFHSGKQIVVIFLPIISSICFHCLIETAQKNCLGAFLRNQMSSLKN